MNKVLFLAAAVVAAASTGCGGARYVHRAGDEGIVAIPANSDAWPANHRSSAMKLIEEHVGPSFDILEEKEVATGQATTNNQNTNKEATINSTIPFLPAEKQTTTTTTTTKDITEYRIHYRKRSGVAVGTPGGGAGPIGGLPMGGVTQAGGQAPAPSVLPGTTAPGAMGGAGVSSFKPGG